jgi:beta-N-acetylhexosaminidase
VTDGVIRGEIGFEGVLLSDDLSMEALKGSLAERAEAVLAGGCDVVLHCSGKLDEMEAVAAASGAMSEAAMARLARGLGMRRKQEPVNRAIVERRIESLLGGGKGSA